MLELELTYPPTINHYYKPGNAKHGLTVHIGKAGMAYRAEVYRYRLEHLNGLCPLKGRLSFEAEIWLPDRRKRDMDNVLKCLWDSLEYAKVIEDDEQFDCMVMYKRGVESPGKVNVTIREI